MENTNEKILIEAGLSEEQALIYGALLDRGPQKASALATWTGVKRGLIYKVLEQLEAMNLVEKKGGEGTVALFAPLHPSSLINMVEARAKSIMLTKETLTYSLGSLASKFNLLTGKPNVQFFEGKEGILKTANDSLNSKTEIYSFVDADALEKLYPELNKEYVEKRLKLKIKKKIIMTDSPTVRATVPNEDKEFTEQRIVKHDFKFATIVMIYDNKVSFITMDPDRSIGVIIEDKDIYNTHKSLFEYIWGTAELV